VVTVAPLEEQPNRFRSLVRAVVFQQLSGKVAESIHTKFLTLFDEGAYPTPEQLVQLDVETLRSKGLSRPKASYLLDLSAKFLDGTIEPEKFDAMSDDEVREAITKVKGFGVWSADMFLIFTLHRPDVWPTLDNGVQRAYARLMGREELIKPKELAPLGDPYRPYRSLAAITLWRSLDAEIPITN
jgi:3-methyladenine DNA glycosylase/8-oxoguanine DNA glycosylase